MKKDYKNIQELIWLLAKTDFKLRYQGSVLGYVWAILKPLALFTILNFVFLLFLIRDIQGVPTTQ
jgi:ABC-2 type transport system permease protein